MITHWGGSDSGSGRQLDIPSLTAAHAAMCFTSACALMATIAIAQLYGDVRLSIHPPTHTPHMFSWFPIFFPLREPVLLAAGQPLEAHMWRCTAHHKVIFIAP